MTSRAKWILGIAALGVVLAPLGYVWNYDRQTGARTDAALTKLRSLGHPVTLEEYEQTRPDEAENAAAILKDLNDKWTLSQKGKIDTNSNGPIPAKTLAFLKDNEALIPTLDRINARPRLWLSPDRKVEKENSDLMTASRNWSRVLTFSARRQAQLGQVEGAKKRLATARALGDLWNHEGSMIGALIGMSIHATADRTILALIAESPTLAQKKAWRGSLSPEPYLYDMKSMVGRENVLYRYVFSADLSGWTPDDSVTQALLRLPQIRRRMLAFGLEDWAEIAELANDGQFNKADSVQLQQRLQARLAAESVGRDLISMTSGYFTEAFTEENAIVKFEHRNAVADVLIELAGGPKAVLGPKLQVKRLGAVTEVIHPEATFSYKIEKGQITSSSTARP